MRVTKIFCDKCNKEIDESEATDFQNKDLCSDCVEKAYSMIMSWIAEKQETVQKKAKTVEEFEKTVAEKVKTDIKAEKTEQKAEEKKNPVRIDWDKACALKLSGWKNADIAAELGINKATVESTIYEKLTQYKKARGLK